MNKILLASSILAISASTHSADLSISCFPTSDNYSVESINVYATNCLNSSFEAKPDQITRIVQLPSDNLLATLSLDGKSVSVEMEMFYPDYDLISQEVMK